MAIASAASDSVRGRPDIRSIFDAALADFVRRYENGDSRYMSRIYHMLDVMIQHLPQELDIYHNLLKGSVDSDFAMGIFRHMQRPTSLTPDSTTYKLLIEGCAKNGDSSFWASSLMREMKDRDLRPDRETYSAVIKACERQKWSADVFGEACQWYSDAEAAGIYAPWSDDGMKLDLHGFSVPEARVALTHTLCSYAEGTRPLPTEKLIVVTGRGKHSEEGRGVLRHVAPQFFESQGIKVLSETGPDKNAGRIYVPRMEIEKWIERSQWQWRLRGFEYSEYFDHMRWVHGVPDG